MEWRKLALILAALAALAVVPYLPALALPFISDDYVQIHLARRYGPVSGWLALAADPLYRCRATSLLLTYLTECVFGLNSAAFTATGMGLHVLNTWLVLALGVFRTVGFRVSAAAAAFFAIYEGHQEAVVWYAALPELLVFLFGLLALLAWMRGRYVAALAAFVLALLSKESAVALVVLLPLAWRAETNQWRGGLVRSLPFAALALVYTAAILAGRSGHQHFHDGTFSFDAPFLLVWANSFWRLFWIWGLLSLGALAAWGTAELRRTALLAGIWIAITLLPYSFLTYMLRVPSRHTYFASAGLSLVAAAGFLALRQRFQATHRWLPGAVAALALVHNCGYVWTKKQAQFVARAAPTEALIRHARRGAGPVYLHCFPYSRWIAQFAVEVGAGRPDAQVIFSSDAPLCFGHPGPPLESTQRIQ